MTYTSFMAPRALSLLLVVLLSCRKSEPTRGHVSSHDSGLAGLETEELVARFRVSPNDSLLAEALRTEKHHAKALELLLADYREATRNESDAERSIGRILRTARVSALDRLFTAVGEYAGAVALEAVNDPSPDVRAKALHGLDLRSPVGVATLREALRDEAPTVVLSALEILSQHPDHRAGPRILEILRAPNEPTRNEYPYMPTYNVGGSSGYTRRPVFEAAMEAVGNSRYAAALPVLIEFLRSSSATIRGKAVVATEALAVTANESSRGDAIRALTRLLSDPTAEVRETAIGALKRLGHPSKAGPRLPIALLGEEKALFDRLFKTFLFDPRGTRSVRVVIRRRTLNGKGEEGTRLGWLVTAAGGSPARVVFADGESVPAPSDPVLEDLAAAAREVIRTNTGEADMLRVAWLYRLGEESLSAEMLFLARGKHDSEEAMIESLRAGLALSAFQDAVHAFRVRADEEARVHAERLCRLYPDLADVWGTGKHLLADLSRRKAGGVFGGLPRSLPEDMASWPLGKRLERLIEELQEVEAGGSQFLILERDPRAKGILEIGEPAVASLIECVARDRRLTRTVLCWREFDSHRQVLSVSRCALSLLGDILQLGSDTQNRLIRMLDAEGPEAVAGDLDAYWTAYGGLPVAKRMMKILMVGNSESEALREASTRLATGSVHGQLGRVLPAYEYRPEKNPDPMVAGLSEPTAAEAILAVLDRELARHERALRDSLWEYHGRKIAEHYISALIILKDGRFLPECRRRFEGTKDPSMRRRWAVACWELGDRDPLDRFARDFAQGAIVLPENDRPQTNPDEQPGTLELTAILACLKSGGTPACQEALEAVDRQPHPYHLAVKRLRAR